MPLAVQSTDPYAKYGGSVADDSDIEQPIASVRTAANSNVGDSFQMNGQDVYVSGVDSKGRKTLSPGKPPAQSSSDPYAKYGGKVAASSDDSAADPYAKYNQPQGMTRPQADDYFQTLAAGGTKPYQPPKQPSFANTALVDPESPVFGEPIHSSIHPDTRGGRNLVPVQDVAATRQQMQYEAAHPEEMAHIEHSQAMSTGLPLADRLRARAGLEARKRTELGQSVSDVNDQYLNYVGDKGADAGENFAQFMARNFQTENPQATPSEIGAARSVGKNVARTVADPVSSAAVLTGGVGGRAGQVALSSLFATGAAKQSYDAVGQLGSIWDRPDISPQQKAEMASDLVLNTAMAGMAGAHALKVPFIEGTDPLLSRIPQEYRDAVTQKINSTLSKTGGVLSRAASTVGDVMADVAKADRENIPTQGVQVLRRSLPKVPIASAESALPLVRAVAENSGYKTIRAEDLLDSAPDKDGAVRSGLIGQAKKEVLAQAGKAAGEGRTIADLSPEEAQPFIQKLDALDELHDHIQIAQEQETLELKKAAEKGKIPATQAAALVRMGMGAGKVAFSASAGPTLGRMSRVLLSAYGIPSGFNDLVTGVKGLIGAGGKISPTLDENLNAAMGKTLPGAMDTAPSFDTRESATPFDGDTSVNHDSLIFPPETPHGDATMLRDEPNPRFQMSSSSTAQPLPTRQFSLTGNLPPVGVDDGIGTSTAFPQGAKPGLTPRQFSLTPSQPASMPSTPALKEFSAPQANQPQTGRQFSLEGTPAQHPLVGQTVQWVSQGAEQFSEPRKVTSVVEHNGKQFAMVEGSNTGIPINELEIQNMAPKSGGDIFPNDKAMEDWLQSQEDNSPAIQRARQNAQRIRDAREVPAQNPGDITVPRGQHPESIVERALTSLSLPDLREAARAGGIDYTAADSNSDLIRKIMDAYAGQDDHLSDLAETLQGNRGAVPAGPREKPPLKDFDLTGPLQQSLDAANARKATGGTGPLDRRQGGNRDFRDSINQMSPADKDAALLQYHQNERTSAKTGLPNQLAFDESTANLGETHPHIGFADADDFKLLNDTFDHKYVDQKVLRPIGELMAAAVAKENGAIHAFHISGDEFAFRASDPAAVSRVVDYVNEQMAGARFEVQKPDGTTVTREGVGLSHGTGSTQEEAEAAALADKAARRTAGLRTGKRDATQNPNPTAQGSSQGQQNPFSNTPERQGLLTPQGRTFTVPRIFGAPAEDVPATPPSTSAKPTSPDVTLGGQLQAGLSALPAKISDLFGPNASRVLNGESGVRRAADLQPGDAAMVPTADLNADPERFQYKGGTDEQGVTNALKDQNKYDQNKGGVLLVWKDPANGKVYVVNGHHRFELAQRAGEPNVLARMIDAPTAEDAKVIGAETNISEGHGSIVDAARFFKAAKISTPQDAMNRNLPLGQGKVTDGLAMARLDSSILDRVESGDIPEGRAVAIGKVTDNPAQQDAVLQAIAKRESRTGKTLTNGEAESIARQVRDADTHIQQGQDLFGAFNREQSLFGEQAEIDDYILKQLRGDKRTFGAVSSKTRAETLGKVKNQSINPEENQRISEQAAQAAEMYQKLVNGPGVLNDIRKNAAKELASRYSKPQDVKAKAYERIRQELQGQLGASDATTGTEGRQP